MKKLLWSLCVIAVLLSAAAGGFALAYLTEEVTFDQIEVSGCGIPDKAACTIRILHEGDYPGLSDFPVTAEQAAPGRAALNALRGQKYTRVLPFLKPGKGGIAVCETSGCSSSYIAYWDGKYLWASGEGEKPWRGYAPSSPDELREVLQVVMNN